MNLIVPLIVMPIPVVITVLVIQKTILLRKSKAWVEGRARITASSVRHEHQRFAGDTTKVTNKAVVKYEFDVGSEKFHGQRIGIGDTAPDQIGATVQRYAIGTSVPVFYDPANPTQCVLERDAPVSLGCMWGGAAAALALGAALTFVFTSGDSIDELLSKTFPSVHNPLLAFCIAMMGSVALLMYWAMLREASRARAWPVRPGKIVSSTTESFVSINGRRRTTMYRAVIEYVYEVDGQQYESSRIRYGAVDASNSQARADKAAARYPVDKQVDVRSDPADPTSAVLELGLARGGLLLVVGLCLLGVAVYAALHA